MRYMGQRGDTLIEVTFALTILASVLIGATAIALGAFRTGELAKERTQVSQDAQLQAEALRTFRDNHTWDEFRFGLGPTTPGVENVGTHTCHFDSTQRCFHMTVEGTTGREWYPQQDVYDPSLASSVYVPTSFVEIRILPSAAPHTCSITFSVDYWFTPQGSQPEQRNHITTQLANLKPTPGGCP